MSASRGIRYGNAFFEVISRPPPWRVTRRYSNNQFVVHRGRAIPSASCQCVNNWRAWPLTMLITLGASCCFASSVEHGRLPLAALAGDGAFFLPTAFRQDLTLPRSMSMLKEPLWQFAWPGVLNRCAF